MVTSFIDHQDFLSGNQPRVSSTFFAIAMFLGNREAVNTQDKNGMRKTVLEDVLCRSSILNASLLTIIHKHYKKEWTTASHDVQMERYVQFLIQAEGEKEAGFIGASHVADPIYSYT